MLQKILHFKITATNNKYRQNKIAFKLASQPSNKDIFVDRWYFLMVLLNKGNTCSNNKQKVKIKTQCVSSAKCNMLWCCYKDQRIRFDDLCVFFSDIDFTSMYPSACEELLMIIALLFFFFLFSCILDAKPVFETEFFEKRCNYISLNGFNARNRINSIEKKPAKYT